jgi:hypothetical protein
MSVTSVPWATLASMSYRMHVIWGDLGPARALGHHTRDIVPWASA